MEVSDLEILVLDGLKLLGFDFKGFEKDIGYKLLPANLRRGEARNMEHIVHFLLQIILKASFNATKKRARQVYIDPFKDLWPIIDATSARDFRRIVIHVLHSREFVNSENYRIIVSMSLLQHPHGDKYLQFLSVLTGDAIQSYSPRYMRCRKFPMNYGVSQSGVLRRQTSAYRRRCMAEKSLFIANLKDMLKSRAQATNSVSIFNEYWEYSRYNIKSMEESILRASQTPLDRQSLAAVQKCNYSIKETFSDLFEAGGSMYEMTEAVSKVAKGIDLNNLFLDGANHLEALKKRNISVSTSAGLNLRQLFSISSTCHNSLIDARTVKSDGGVRETLAKHKRNIDVIKRFKLSFLKVLGELKTKNAELEDRYARLSSKGPKTGSLDIFLSKSVKNEDLDMIRADYNTYGKKFTVFNEIVSEEVETEILIPKKPDSVLRRKLESKVVEKVDEDVVEPLPLNSNNNMEKAKSELLLTPTLSPSLKSTLNTPFTSARLQTDRLTRIAATPLLPDDITKHGFSREESEGDQAEGERGSSFWSISDI